MENQYLLEMQNISKGFPGVQAIKQVDFKVGYGEVHGLMGENGAGKSTLMKILNGLYSSDSGRVLFDGKEIHPQSSLEAQKLGISTIYQELNLIPELSICENIYIGREPMGKWGIDWKKIENNARVWAVADQSNQDDWDEICKISDLNLKNLSEMER